MVRRRLKRLLKRPGAAQWEAWNENPDARLVEAAQNRQSGSTWALNRSLSKMRAAPRRWAAWFQHFGDAGARFDANRSPWWACEAWDALKGGLRPANVI